MDWFRKNIERKNMVCLSGSLPPLLPTETAQHSMCRQVGQFQPHVPHLRTCLDSLVPFRKKKHFQIVHCEHVTRVKLWSINSVYCLSQLVTLGSRHLRSYTPFSVSMNEGLTFINQKQIDCHEKIICPFKSGKTSSICRLVSIRIYT